MSHKVACEIFKVFNTNTIHGVMLNQETIRDFAKTIMLDVINDLGSNAGFERILVR